ncbi:hypothetical protein F994_00963 [Acinetobacter bohemicus ANC 3994]|uniref:Uncharacterized protein n=1 Tax=Acinetobacter bohemicus ANC 3994 TaxID=1217715 RepID=N8P2V3_9GAMM|nr:hypothetical protein [Acinetobacter bohemicus]ENU20730.1 hypothetical protein F994_00963 [Acinetobacter bohemicus ANC 3994]
MNLERRTVQVYNLPVDSDISLLKPEQVILRFPHGKTIDIGSLCYLIRQPIAKSHLGARRNSKSGRLVQISSIYEQRKQDIRLLISHISEYFLHSGKRVETIKDMVSRLVVFIYWADQNGFFDVLNKKQLAKNAIIQYTHYLKERVSRNEINVNSGARQQNTIIQFLCDFFEDEELKFGIFLIRVNSRLKKHTQSPCENVQGRILSLCENIFDGLTSLVLEHKQYPYKLVMPDHLNFTENILWIFPVESWFIHPSKALRKRHSCLAYNYLTGTLNTLEQIAELRLRPNTNISKDYSILKQAEHNLIAANKNYRHNQRMHVGTIAVNAFIILFFSQTGMNLSQALNLSWGKDYEISSSNQSFRIVKWRAGGKECSFEVPLEFMPRFKKFIALREYLLNEQECEYLFFTLGERGLGAPRQLKSGTLHGIYLSLRRIDPYLQMVQSREWRAAKSDWLVRNTDLATAASVLQNTEKTVLSSYIAGSESSHWEELSSFLHNMSNVVLSTKNDQKNLLKSATGQCSSFGNPLALNNEDSINKPNCIDPEGCLFCDKYRIHVDETDIRKLISCRYCIEKTAHIIGSLEEQRATLRPILSRIDLILDKLKEYNEQLVTKILLEVEEGELDDYWARKLEMFMELEWIT